MDTVFKLVMLLFVNLTALGYLLFELIKRGNSYPRALRMAWEQIMLGGGENSTSGVSIPGKWVHLLRKTWWLMVFLYVLFWITSSQFHSTILFFILLLLHGYWYLHGAVYPVKVRDQILFANGNWGIVYTGIDKYSSWEQKSLADLDLRKKNLLVLAVEHEGQWSPFPKGSEVLLPDDQILLFGAMSSYRELNR
jgi:hypothetical protein